jgi:predicted permease
MGIRDPGSGVRGPGSAVRGPGSAVRGLRMSAVTTFLEDLRHAVRGFIATPGFAVAAVLSVAIGIGANTAIFSVASALLLRPLPYQDPQRLVILWNTSPGLGITEDWFSTAQYFDIKSSTQTFEQVAIAIGRNANLTGKGEPERVGALAVSPNLLTMLGARAAHGRLLIDADAVPGTTGRVVLGYATWMRRFGGRVDAIGTTMILDGRPFEIVGVLPASFDVPREVMPTLGGAERAEVIAAIQLAADAAEVRNGEDFNILAKLKPGVAVEQARAEMAILTARLRGEHPDFYPANGGLTFNVLPLQEQVVGGVRRSLIILVGAVAFVLLIACANVANLLLSRALARRKEMAVRSALGATASRLTRQLLTESLLLAVTGGAIGLAVAWFGLATIRTFGVGTVPRLAEIEIDATILIFTLVISLASGVLFGVAPVWRLRRLNLQDTLKDAARGSAGTSGMWNRGNHTRRLLVIGELSLSVVLLIGAGLLIRSFVELRRVPPGFNADSVLTLEITMTGRKYGDAETVRNTYKLLYDRLRQLPGVTAVGGVTALPLSQMMAWGPITVEGRIPPAGEKFINADIRNVWGDYFRAMEIPLIRGRLFNEHDTPDSPRVVIIDEQMAAQLWPNTDPIGKRMRTGGFDATADTPWMTVIGIVGRVKQDALDSDPRIAFYRAHTQFSSRGMNVVMRSATDPAALAATVRREFRELDPDLPLYKVRTMAERVAESLARRRFVLLLLSVFAAVALGLATIGVYGVMAYIVNQGTRELGIRIALGATRKRILLLVVGQGMSIALVGIALGLIAAVMLGRLMQALLFGVRATDPLTFTTIALLLGTVALVASYLPARRATRVDPLEALRSE